MGLFFPLEGPEETLERRPQLDSSGIHLVKDKPDEQIRLNTSFGFSYRAFPIGANIMINKFGTVIKISKHSV